MAKQKHKVETYSRNVLEALERLDPLPLFCDLGYSLETCKAKGHISIVISYCNFWRHYGG